MITHREYALENQEWLSSFQWIIQHESVERAREILRLLEDCAAENNIPGLEQMHSPYVNTVLAANEEEYPGNEEIEYKLSAIIRWNAMAMVVKANKKNKGIGGHISTYSSTADLFEVGFNHFFKITNGEADMIYFQGHAAPGVYARSFVERRFDEETLNNFRLEVQSGKALSSYPHPRLMSNYWQFPTVSMGLTPIQAIYQARFCRYLENRGLKEKCPQHIWAFIGDGEMDEPESLGAITLAAREKLNNLIFVINCNLQRLDGPVRGNGKIIQELEAIFRGAGWKVIKVLWGREWDALFEKDRDGILIEALNKTPDGQMQTYAASDIGYFREHFFKQNENLKELASTLSDEDLQKLRPGGHDPVKIYQAYKAAIENEEGPTVILAQTVKGYGQGKAGEASNIAHQQKILDEDELKYFRDRFGVPVKDEDIQNVPYYLPPENSEEYKYLVACRKKLGGFLPERKNKSQPLQMPEEKIFEKFNEGSNNRKAPTTIVMIQLLSALLKDKNAGKYIVPVIPDESRTFGLDSLFSQAGIYTAVEQNYEPVDKENLLHYKEEKNGVIIEEGITEAGSMATFIAAGTAYANHGLPVIPVFFFYSMFGFQRIGDLVWAAADARARGFMIGGVSGRTSLAGEGLQHCDGQSHVFALAYPNVKAYDPAFAYELAVIIREGIKNMFVEAKDWIYYITIMNDAYEMPPKPNEEGIDADIINGMYCYNRSSIENEGSVSINLLGSGAILPEVIKAAQMLEAQFNLHAAVWSVTSYKQLYDNANNVEHGNRLSDGQFSLRSHIEKFFPTDTTKNSGKKIFVAACDYLKALPLSVAKWFPGKFIALGTDGFGRSDTNAALRNFFEVDARHIVFVTLYGLFEEGMFDKEELGKAMEVLGIDRKITNPADPL
ncbi:pyruvate dehydrogenase (acetyl-transferring), homodimeric type [Niastella populi]|uniref:Pyruvate dehydrogenase E1 component n=1 Tax=Niastella populi TaxID=550983 RepID=A0A1V9G1M6_9BACT|nr:pyruvate dehydrogenase (acetyl-transferring), homodimeric type [Niastella populi]OQP64523.1 pyruvate dehydrogenase (acetyl-transferring), homodimeric type [Niastella populi]